MAAEVHFGGEAESVVDEVATERKVMFECLILGVVAVPVLVVAEAAVVQMSALMSEVLHLNYQLTAVGSVVLSVDA